MQEVPADSTARAMDGDLGATLRAARERRNVSVHQAAQDMHVGDYVIDALERDDYASLGAAIFVRGHLRGYARLLGLAESEVLAAYESAAGNKPPAPPLITQRPGSGGVLARRLWLQVSSGAVIVLLLALAVSWWMHRPAEEVAPLPAPHAVSTTPQPVNTPLPAVVSAGLPGSAVPRAAAEEKKPPAVKSGAKAHIKTADRSSFAVERTVKPASQPAAAVNPPAPGNPRMSAQPPATEPAAVVSQHLTHVVFTLSQASWIEVYDANGKRLYYDLAPAGDSFGVSGAGPLQVFLGNAPGVSMELDGAPFDMTPYLRPDNTARFRLGGADGDGG